MAKNAEKDMNEDLLDCAVDYQKRLFKMKLLAERNIECAKEFAEFAEGADQAGAVQDGLATSQEILCCLERAHANLLPLLQILDEAVADEVVRRR